MGAMITKEQGNTLIGIWVVGVQVVRDAAKDANSRLFRVHVIMLIRITS